MSATEREYVLGTGDAELARLGFQHQVWASATAAAWERGGFRPGARILDVGCGPGYATFDLAHLVGPAGHVLAVDVSARFIDYLDAERRRRGVEHVEARVEDLEELSVSAASVDGAFARWVLCFVRRPEVVVQHVARALRPGGAFVVMDYCNYEGFTVAPRDAAIDRVVAAVARSFRRHGGDPNVGSALPAFMRGAGLEVRTLRPLVRLARPGSALWEWPGSFFTRYVLNLVQMGEITDEERLAFLRAWEERSRSPDAFLLTPPMVEVVGVKPG
jgi:ubiquinone/menaquinone biosynthesis C-methylase UbiE